MVRLGGGRPVLPCVILLLIFVLLPWREGEKKRNAILIICSVVVYWVCETIVSYYPPGGAPQYLLLFVGGIALAITYGRVIRCVWEWKPGFRR